MEILIADKPTLDSVKRNTSTILQTLKLGKPTLFGFRINKLDSNPDTRVEYMYEAKGRKPAKMIFDNAFDYGDWGNAWFIKENKPCVLGTDGDVIYELNPNSFGTKKDGSLSDVSSTAEGRNVMVSIPIVWIHQYQTSQWEYTLISNAQYNENFKAYAHTHTNGTITDVKYLACYTSTIVNGKLRSVSGQLPTGSLTADQMHTDSTANGLGWNMRAWCDRNLINNLLLLIGRSDNSQTTFGFGNTNYNTSGSYPYGILNSGTLNEMGMFYGYDDYEHQVKVFGIEGWWGNVSERVHGIMSSMGHIKVKMNPPYNVAGTDYTESGVVNTVQSFGSVCDKTQVTPYGRIPISNRGSSSTYLCDAYWFDPSINTFATMGGNLRESVTIGMNYFSLYNLPTATDYAVCSALSYETTPATT